MQPATTKLKRYLECLDMLCEVRRRIDSGHAKSTADQPLLAESKDLYAALSESEKQQVERPAVSWREWPHMVDKPPIYFCTICGGEECDDGVRYGRRRIQRDHEHWSGCIGHLRNRLSDVESRLPSNDPDD